MIVTLLILSCLGAATTTSDTLTGENVCSKQVGGGASRVLQL